MYLMNDSNINLDNMEHEHRVTVVCVTDQFQCERIIKAGRIIADLTNTDLSVINVAKPGQLQNPQSLQHLFDVSRLNDGMMSIIYAEDPTKAIMNYIKQHKTGNVLTGMPENENSILYTVWEKFTHVTFFAVTPEGELKEMTKAYRTAQAV